MLFNTTKYTNVMQEVLATSGSKITIAAKKIQSLTSNATFLSTRPPSFDVKHSHRVIQLGLFLSRKGRAQNINIQGLVSSHWQHLCKCYRWHSYRTINALNSRNLL